MWKEAPPEWVERVFFSESMALEDAPRFGSASSFPYEVVKDDVFARMCDTQTPQGVLTLLRTPRYEAEDIRRERGLYVVLENLQDPGNLGTVLRTSEAAGVDGVILTKGCVDITSPKVIRSTMGSIYRMPFVLVEDVAEAAALLRGWGVSLYAAHLKGKASYEEEDYLQGTAFLIGNEGNGLTDEAAGEADHLIRIPMAGRAESLNAAVAAAVLAYEAARQRRRAGQWP